MATGWGRGGLGAVIGTMLALGTASGARAVDFDAAFAETPRWSPWVEFGGYYGSDNASRGEIAGWLPLIQGSDRLLFLDARGKLFEDEFFEGNVAVGGRAMLGNGWNIGVWGGYDARKSRPATSSTRCRAASRRSARSSTSAPTATCRSMTARR